MSVVAAYDVSHVRFGVPDLPRMRAFLVDFGLAPIASDPTRMFSRGYEGFAFAHAVEYRETPAFLGFGIALSNEADLHVLAAHEQMPVEPLDAPGGGSVLRLVDPDGYTVEVIAGQAPAAAMPAPPSEPWNQGGEYPRRGVWRRIQKGPSHVRRLGHVVLGVADFRRSEAWYKERFGFVTSDEIQPAPGVAIGAFMRCDRGEVSCDHHTLFLMEAQGQPGFMHAAFEVRDLDDLMAGHDHLVAGGYHHQWGIGRHYLGSQVFDYWRDPFGFEIEHWTDGDQLTAADGGGVVSVDQLLGVQWGMEIPMMPPVSDPEQRR